MPTRPFLIQSKGSGVFSFFQAVPVCFSLGRTCYQNVSKKDRDCYINCNGLYADIDFNSVEISNNTKDHLALERLSEAYKEYKAAYVKNMFIDRDEKLSLDDKTRYKPSQKPYHPLQVVQIYFDTATYDEIVKDVSVTLADQLGAIGGTMGLFAGFSFLSAVEVLYFLLKYFLDLLLRKYSS